MKEVSGGGGEVKVKDDDTSCSSADVMDVSLAGCTKKGVSMGRVLRLYIILQTVGFSQCLRLINMSAPSIADPRESMHLDCHFNMGAEVLYAVKWYKDDQEFFRFMPHQQPHMISYPVAGVQMVDKETRCGETRCKVRLTNLTRGRSDGAYRCEVSSEAPAFRLALETHNVTVAALPRSGPRIEGLADSYSLGENLMAICTSAPANPIPAISWYINDQSVSPLQFVDAHNSETDLHGLATRTVTLKVPVERKYLQGSVIHIRCEASLPGVPVEPQSATRTVIVRTRSPEVINEKLHSPNNSCSPSISAAATIRTIIFVVLLFGWGVKWRRQSC